MTYKELQTALKEFRSLGYELETKLNANKDDLLDEYNRLVAAKENFEQLTSQAETLAAVAESAEPEIKLNLTEMEEFLDRAIAYENSESVDPEEAQAINNRAAVLLAAMDKKEIAPTEPEIQVPFILAPISAFEGIETEELGDWWVSTPLTCDPCNYQSVLIPTIPQPLQYLQDFFSDGDETIDARSVEAWEVAEFYGATSEVSPRTVPAPAPTTVNHASVGLTLIVLFLQALQLVTTVAIPLLIQSYAIGRKTFDAVAMAFQSEAVLRLVDAS